jgi:hypothetical protein
VIADRYRTMRECIFADCVALVDGMADRLFADGEIPFLHGNSASMEVARLALQRLPNRLLKILWMNGCQITIEPVECLPSDSIYLDVGERAAAGLTNGKTARIAGKCPDLAMVVLHEAAHIFDGVIDISRSPQWRNLWQSELQAGRVPELYRQRDFPAEFFAESFAAYWIGPSTRAPLTPQVRQFMSESVRWFNA